MFSMISKTKRLITACLLNKTRYPLIIMVSTVEARKTIINTNQDAEEGNYACEGKENPVQVVYPLSRHSKSGHFCSRPFKKKQPFCSVNSRRFVYIQYPHTV